MEPFTIHKGALEVHAGFEAVRVSATEAVIRQSKAVQPRAANLLGSKELLPAGDGSVARVRCVCRGEEGSCELLVTGNRVTCVPTQNSGCSGDCVIERVVLG